MPHPSSTREKYRPVLTATQITHILSLAQRDIMLSDPEKSTSADISFSIISSLAPFSAKIAVAGITPSYTIDPPKLSTLDLLGGVVCDDESIGVPEDIPANFESKEAYWDYCYTKYELDISVCTPAELIAKDEHRYLNGLMTPVEQANFEGKGGQL